MRYIGNKTRLLPFIVQTLRRLGVKPGIAHDAFAGTAAVGRAFKLAGWRVVSSDLMTYSYVLQRAYVVASKVPGIAALSSGDADVRRALRSTAMRERSAARGLGRLGAVAEYLESWIEPESGFISNHFAPAGGRMYFTPENAGRIDAAWRALHRWRRDGLVEEDAYYILLAAIIDGADRVANTAGVYAAFIKRWQPNALRRFTIVPERPLPGRGSSAHVGDATEVAREAGPLDVLYLDPPYNARQYSGYYHIPEILARGWSETGPTLRGKVGLLADKAPRSLWCRKRKVRGALRDLLSATGARHVLVSYNSEGILPAPQLEEELAAAAIDGAVNRFTQPYRRYRADSDHEGRRYKRDHVQELLYHVRLR